MARNYSGVFYIFFKDEVEYQIPWDSSLGVYSLGTSDIHVEMVRAVKGNIQANTDANGIIEYSPVGPKFLSTLMDPKVVYLGLKLTFPDATEIAYRGSLDDLESWNAFTAALSSGVDEHGEAIVS
jgi:hypothetical protein